MHIYQSNAFLSYFIWKRKYIWTSRPNNIKKVILPIFVTEDENCIYTQHYYIYTYQQEDLGDSMLRALSIYLAKCQLFPNNSKEELTKELIMLHKLFYYLHIHPYLQEVEELKKLHDCFSYLVDRFTEIPLPNPESGLF